MTRTKQKLKYKIFEYLGHHWIIEEISFRAGSLKAIARKVCDVDILIIDIQDIRNCIIG